jgi:hypothetical protein
VSTPKNGYARAGTQYASIVGDDDASDPASVTRRPPADLSWASLDMPAEPTDSELHLAVAAAASVIDRARDSYKDHAVNTHIEEDGRESWLHLEAILDATSPSRSVGDSHDMK